MRDAAIIVLFLLLVLDMVMMVVGLINPRKAMPKDPNPTRVKVLTGGGGLAFILILAMGFLASPSKKSTDVAANSTAVAPVPTAAAESDQPYEGINITRTAALQHFARIGFKLEDAKNLDGQPRMNVVANNGVAEIAGRDDNLRYILLIYFYGQPMERPAQSILQTVQFGCPAWNPKEVIAWVEGSMHRIVAETKATNYDQSITKKTTCGGTPVTLKNTPNAGISVKIGYDG